MSDMIGLAIIIGGLLLVFALSELFYCYGKKFSLTRKFAHIGAGVVVAGMPMFISQSATVAVGLIFTAVLLLSRRYRWLKSVHHPKDLFNFGPELFALSMALSAWLFWEIDVLIFQGTALILGLSDGLAGLVGTTWGQRQYRLTGLKTWEGSVVFFLTTFVVFMVIFYISPLDAYLIPQALVGSLLLTLVEGAFSRGWDNLFIALTSGIYLLLVL